VQSVTEHAELPRDLRPAREARELAGDGRVFRRRSAATKRRTRRGRRAQRRESADPGARRQAVFAAAWKNEAPAHVDKPTLTKIRR